MDRISPRTDYSIDSLDGPSTDDSGDLYLLVGQSAQFTATGSININTDNEQDGVDLIDVFDSTDYTVADVDPLGVVTGVAPGDATIYVDDDSDGGGDDSTNAAAANSTSPQPNAGSKKQKVVHTIGVKLTQSNYPGASASQEIKAGQTAYITADPTMPQLVAQIAGTPPSGANVTYTLKTTYKRRGSRDNVTFTSGSIPATQPWDIGAAFGQTFCGGSATLTYQIDKMKRQSLSFTIKGKNPLDQDAKSYIIGQQGSFRFAWAIVQEESRTYDRTLNQDTSYNEFYPSDAQGGIANLPKFGNPDGWGMFQRDTSKGGPPSLTAEVWNWKQNIAAGITELGSKQTVQQRFFDAVKAQYSDTTKYPTGTYEDPPASFYPQGTGTTMSALEAGTMTLYNGAGGCPTTTLTDPTTGKATTYQNPWVFDPNGPTGYKWSFYPNNNNYVYEVIYGEYEGHKPFVEGP